MQRLICEFASRHTVPREYYSLLNLKQFVRQGTHDVGSVAVLSRRVVSRCVGSDELAELAERKRFRQLLVTNWAESEAELATFNTQLEEELLFLTDRPL